MAMTSILSDPLTVFLIKCFHKGSPPPPMYHGTMGFLTEWNRNCGDCWAGQSTIKLIIILQELSVLLGVPKVWSSVRSCCLLKKRLLGYKGKGGGWGVHSCKGSRTRAWHFLYLHCLMVSVDLFMIFPPHCLFVVLSSRLMLYLSSISHPLLLFLFIFVFCQCDLGFLNYFFYLFY